MFHSYTYGDLTLQEIPSKLKAFYEKNKVYDSEFQIIVGTDSQNSSKTKMVTVIAIICKGHGGIFFYKITYLPLIKNLKKKLHEETNDSIQTTYELLDIIENNEEYEEILCSIPISIHVDLGNAGESRFMKSEIVGWITGLGLDYSIKPDSFVASTIADKISK